MRSITALSLGALAFAGAFVALVAVPTARGDGDCVPAAVNPQAAVPAAAPNPPAAQPLTMRADAVKPTKEAAIKSPLLLALVGEWGCDCAYPTGGHAAGDATAKMMLDGTALMTESSLDWTVGEGKDKEKISGVAMWKVGTDGKTLNYWGFSSHDATADMLTGTLTDTNATVSGTTRYGPMRLSLTLKDGVLSQQLWIDKQDMGVISYKKKAAQ